MLDAETARLWAEMRAAGAPRVDESDIAAARAAMRARQKANPPGPELAEVQDVWIRRTTSSGISARLYRPVSAEGFLVFYHGGGWVLGDVDGFDHYARRLADRLRMVVVSPEYRLAPEHPFPAAADDAWLTYKWACSQLVGASSTWPVLVGGESAGANLAAVVAQDAARSSRPADGQILIYPVIDATFDRPSYSEPENQLLVDSRLMRWFWDQYVPNVDSRTDPRASPIYGDLSGLPSAVLVTAEHDPLRDEGEAYAAALASAGVPVQIRRFEGQMHGFATMPVLPQSAVLLDYVHEAVRIMLRKRVDLSPSTTVG